MVEIASSLVNWYETRIYENEKIPQFIRGAIGWLLMLVLVPMCLVGTIVAGFCLLVSTLIGTVSPEWASEQWKDLCSYFEEL